ncbi:MAG: 50S ribosomal protein L23 [archaeon]
MAETRLTNLKSYDIVLHPLITEKSVNAIEKENKLVFVVNKRSTKKEIREAIEDLYDVKIDSINVVNDMKGRKKAFVRINKKFKANDIAVKLGII